MDVRLNIVGHANMGPAAKELRALQTQIVSLQKQMEKAHSGSAAVAPQQARLWRNASRVMEQTYNDAVASTGRFLVAQQKVNNVTDDFIARINKQKVSFGDLRREMATAQAAYQQHLRMQKATVASFRTDAQGNVLANLAVPKNIASDLDSVRQRLGYVRALTQSIGTQTINWGKNIQWSGRQMTMGMTYPLGLLAAASGVAAYQVDENLTRIAKVYDTTAQSGIEQERELAQVRVESMQTAKNAAREYGAAAKDTLDIQGQWAAMGIRGADLQKQTAETVRLATLGEIDHQTAIGATIAMQSVFKMSTEETAEAINYMNAVENATILSLEDFATAIPIAAAPVRQMGGDLKDLGVMLTAMRARGIEANEGANAIKAAMTRIFRPSKQIREEFRELTNVDLTELVNKTQGELIPTLQEIGKAVDGLSNINRTKVISGLFGTYQNTRLSGLLAGMFEDFDDESSQVFRALEAGALSAEETATMAATEMARQQESASGRIKRAWETLRANLAADGMGFLSLGAGLLEAANNVLKGWEKVPDFFKSMIKYGAMAAAAIGPVVMTVGVLGNAFGMGLRTFAKFLPSVELLTSKEKAQRAVLDELRRSNQLAEQSTEGFRVEIEALTKALERAGAAKQKYLTTAIVDSGDPLTGKSSIAGSAVRGLPVSQTMPAAFTVGRAGVKPLAGAALQARVGKEYADEIAKGLEAEKKLTEVTAKRSQLMGGMALSTGLMAAGTLAQVAPMGKIADSAGKLANNVALALMATSSLTPLFGGLKDRITLMATNIGSKGVLGSIKGLAMSLNPVTIGIAAAVAGTYTWYKAATKTSKELEKARTSADALGDAFGFEASTGPARKDEEGNVDKTAERVRKINEEYGVLIANIRDAKTEQEAFERASALGMLAFNRGASEEDAKEVVRVALMAARDEAFANSVMMHFDFDPSNVNQVVQSALKQLEDDLAAADSTSLWKKFWGDDDKMAETAGTAFGESLSAGLANAIQSGQYTDALMQYEQSMEKFSTEMEAVGGTLGKKSATKFVEQMLLGFGMGPSAVEKRLEEIKKSAEASARSAGFVDGDGNVVYNGESNKLMAEETLRLFEETLKTLDTAEAKAIVIGNALKEVDAILSSSGDAEALNRYDNIMGQIADKHKISAESAREQVDSAIKSLASGEKITSLTATQYSLLRSLSIQLDVNLLTQQGIAMMIERQNNGLISQAGLEAAKGVISDAISNKMKNNSNTVASVEKKNNDAAIAGIEKKQGALDDAHKKQKQNLDDAHKKQQQNLEDEHDREQKLLDKRWNKREKQLQKERDLNKKKYDDEIDYIKRTLEAQNRQTDMTIALRQGDLDQVAKLQAEAHADSMIDALTKARDKSDEKYQARQDRLKERRKAAEENLKAIQKAEKRAMEERQAREKRAMEESQAREKKALQDKLKALQAETKAVKANNAEQGQSDKAKLDAFLKNLDLTKINSEKAMTALGKKLQNTFGLTKREVAKIFEEMWATLSKSEDPNSAGMRNMKKYITGAGKELGLSYSAASGLAKVAVRKVGLNLGEKDTKGRAIDPRLTKHEGGPLGSRYGNNSRAGYPASASPFPSEVEVLAKKNEYVVSGQAHKKYGTADLDAVNKGKATILRHAGGPVAEHLKMGTKVMGAVTGHSMGTRVANLMKKRKKEQDAIAEGNEGVVGGGGFKRPTGKWNSPWNGHHTTFNGHDYNLVYKPLYAPADGTVTAYALPGVETRRSHGGNGFRSYGQYIKWAGQGQSMMFAHLSKLPIAAGNSMRVKAGQYMGTTGNTGNSSGPHVHVELPFGSGNTGNFGAFFRQAGVSLRKGGKLKYNNTLVDAHKGETVLSSRITKRFEDNLISSADRGVQVETINVTINGEVNKSTGRRVAMDIKKELDRESRRYGKGK